MPIGFDAKSSLHSLVPRNEVIRPFQHRSMPGRIYVSYWEGSKLSWFIVNRWQAVMKETSWYTFVALNFVLYLCFILRYDEHECQSHIGIATCIVHPTSIRFFDKACWPVPRWLNHVLWPPLPSFALWLWDRQLPGLKQRLGWMVIELSFFAAEKNLNTHWTPKQLIKHESTNYFKLHWKGTFVFARSQKWCFDLFTLAKPSTGYWFGLCYFWNFNACLSSPNFSVRGFVKIPHQIRITTGCFRT